MIIPTADIKARKMATIEELATMFGEDEDRINRRRVLTAETLILRDNAMAIHNGEVGILEAEMEAHANYGNLNYAAGMERVIKWMKTYDTV